MTKDIGHGTVNLALNLMVEEREILGKLAFQRDCSLGEFLRRMARRGIAQTDPDTAKRLARIRRERLRATRAVILIGITAVHFLMLGGEMRKASSRVRVPQTARAGMRVGRREASPK